MFNMLSSLPQFRLPSEFPPKSIANLDLAGPGILSRPQGGTHTEGLQDMGLGDQVRDLNPQVSNHTPMPRLEIPLFDGI